jgi:hypothetical protein
LHTALSISPFKQFLDQVFNNIYPDSFERVSLSIQSRGIQPDDTDGFVVAVDISGTSYFVDGTGPSEGEVENILKEAFRKYNDLFLDILADSPDTFLSEISYVIIVVNGESVVDTPVVARTKDDDDSLDVWVIATMAAGAGFIFIFAVCLLCICCIGDEDDVNDPIPAIAKSGSNGTQKSKSTKSASHDDESAMNEKDHLEVRSITSQDSSKFTYNPRSVRSSGGFTFASFNTNTPNVEVDIESWQKKSTMNTEGAKAPFGNDISLIEAKKDLSHIVERDEESGSGHDLSLSDLQRKESDRRHYLGNASRASLDLNGNAKDVIDDLNDLSLQVAQYRTSM